MLLNILLKIMYSLIMSHDNLLAYNTLLLSLIGIMFLLQESNSSIVKVRYNFKIIFKKSEDYKKKNAVCKNRISE